MQSVEMIRADMAEDAKGTEVACELLGRARPPAMARANARPQGADRYKLDLTWHGVDRDLWPLASWNMALNETGQRSRYPREGKGEGKSRYVINTDAIWDIAKHPELLELSGADRELVCLRRSPLA
eukprot:s6642_g4.t1